MRIGQRITPLLFAAALSAIAFSACSERNPIGPATPEEEPATRLGLIEVTISGIGGDQLSSSAISVASHADLEALRAARLRAGGDFSPQALTPPAFSGGGGDGTIQLELVSTGSFTEGTRGADGVRYVWASYRVRNAQEDGTPYTTERQNLTFLAVDDAGTVDTTPFSTLRRFDGGAASTAIAAEVVPTGAVTRDLLTNEVVAAGPDVLQILTEAEADAVTPPAGVTDVFPYGFVVRRAGDETTRSLPANPAADQFDGVVTFAFKIPLQASATDDPFTISFVALAVDDSETRITQSPEEQSSDAQAAFEARATSLGATTLNVLPGSGYSGGLGRSFCSVRTAGAAGSPTAYLGRLEASLTALSPDPFANDGSGSFVASGATISADFSSAVGGAVDSTFVVHGLQSGRQFLGQSYDGAGTSSLTTPAGSFLPGEEVEVVLTSGLGDCVTGVPHVARLRVAATGGTGDFASAVDYPTGGTSTTVGAADFDGDGDVDLAVASGTSDSVSVLLNNGNGTFAAAVRYDVGTDPYGLAHGDVDGDGDVDLVVSNAASNDVSVLLNDGTGVFSAPATYGVGSSPYFVALGDVNGDGAPDIVTANYGSDDVSVLLGNGDGTFAAAQVYAAGAAPNALALGDVDADGDLDVVTVSESGGTAVVLPGNGDGTFGAAQSYGVGAGPYWVSAADLDGDGDLDLAVVNSADNDVTVLLNGGAGTFTAAGDYAVGAFPYALAIGDVDGDGDLDIATANYNDNNVSVLRNDGAGTFAAAVDYAAGTDTETVALVDLDGDGDLDIATANNGAGTASVLLNQ